MHDDMTLVQPVPPPQDQPLDPYTVRRNVESIGRIPYSLLPQGEARELLRRLAAAGLFVFALGQESGYLIALIDAWYRPEEWLDCYARNPIILQTALALAEASAEPGGAS